MDVRQIIEAHLVENGFDGLFYPGECSCVRGDIAPCGNISLDCKPGYTVPCSCGASAHTHIGPHKLAEAA